MKWAILLITSFFLSTSLSAQNNWEWLRLSTLPIPLTNNAICEAKISESKYVYSFGGITSNSTKLEVHNSVYKYSINGDFWEKTVEIPESLPKYGSKSSFIKNKIFLIGGTYVVSDTTVSLSNKVHVYNPFLDIFEADAAPIPIPTKQPVQSVWRDSLIYVFGGENQAGNIPEVQIYNPTFNSWSFGTSLPENNSFLSYGASGYILGDTVFYLGGVYSGFEANPYFRKGIINPENPEEIEWSIVFPQPNQKIYKGVCSGNNNTLFCLGGTNKVYNYHFLEEDFLYPEGNKSIIEFINDKSLTINTLSTPYSLSDIENIAKLGGGNWIITGGIDSLNQISDRVFLLHNPDLSDFEKAKKPPYFKINESSNNFTIETENIGVISVFDMSGRRIYRSPKYLSHLVIAKQEIEKGILLFVYEDGLNLPVVLKRLNMY